MKGYRVTIDVLTDDDPTFDPGDPWMAGLFVALADVLRERAFLSIQFVTAVNIVARPDLSTQGDA